MEMPELAPYRTLRRPAEHLRQGMFVAEGGKVVERLLASGLRVESVLLTPRWLDRLREALQAPAAREARIFMAEQELLETIVGFRLHQGVMAAASVPGDPGLEGVMAGARAPRAFLALDGLASAENVGVIVRSAAAFGASAVISGETSASPYLRRAVRNSMGGVFLVPVHHTRSLAEAVGRMRDLGIRCLAADPRGETPLGMCDLREDLCLVLGNEERGVSEGVLAACRRVSIPMEGGTDSLNVAGAAAVFLYEISRQRGAADQPRDGPAGASTHPTTQTAPEAPRPG